MIFMMRTELQNPVIKWNLQYDVECHRIGKIWMNLIKLWQKRKKDCYLNVKSEFGKK